MPNKARLRWGAITGVGVALISTLVFGVASFWQYANRVPPFTAQMPTAPEPNGFLIAEPLLTRLFASDDGRKVFSWDKLPPDELGSRLGPIRQDLDKVRATLRMQWAPQLALSIYDRPSLTLAAPRCAWALVAESRLLKSQGRSDLAMDRCLDAMELGCRAGRGDLLAGLKGRACHAIGLREAERTVHVLSAEGAQAALLRLRRIRDQWPQLSETVENERISKLSCQREQFLLLGRMPVSQQLEDIGRRTGGDDWAQVKLFLTPRQEILTNQDHYFRLLIAEVKKPIRHRTPVSLPPDLWSQGLLAFTDVVTNSWRWEKFRTDLALLEVALAVQADYVSVGHYPRSLSDVSRHWLPAIPLDAWAQPIAYRLKNGKPLVYSLGPDAKDDGGLAADPITVTPSTSGDLVFGHLSRRLRKP